MDEKQSTGGFHGNSAVPPPPSKPLLPPWPRPSRQTPGSGAPALRSLPQCPALSAPVRWCPPAPAPVGAAGLAPAIWGSPYRPCGLSDDFKGYSLNKESGSFSMEKRSLAALPFRVLTIVVDVCAFAIVGDVPVFFFSDSFHFAIPPPVDAPCPHLSGFYARMGRVCLLHLKGDFVAGVFPDQKGLHVIHHHVVVEGRPDHVHQLLAIQVGPDHFAFVPPLHASTPPYILGRFASASSRVFPNRGRWIMPGTGMNTQVSEG